MKCELIDSMGSDLSVVNAARVSFDKESEWEFDRINDSWYLSDKDKKLIKFLARENHFTPFTHCVITLRETVPIFVARQRFKHTVGFTYNEVSRRYVDDAPEFYVPEHWRKRPEGSVKQGSSEETVSYLDWQFDSKIKAGSGPDARKAYKEFIEYAERYYSVLIVSGVAPEQARMVLPQSMYTSYYTTGSLSAFARAYNLRSEESAQKEIQELAISWKNIIEPLFPESWAALTENN